MQNVVHPALDGPNWKWFRGIGLSVILGEAKMNTKQRKYKNAVIVVLAILLLLFASRGFSQEKAFLATTKITLKGNAQGGVLTLVSIANRNTRHFSIFTESGESSESVAMRLADTINNLNPFRWGGTFEVISKDGSLTLLGPPGTYASAGTEKGLGIPEPPTSLSGRYDMDNNQVILNWQNPASGFDKIFVNKCGYPYPTYSMIAGSEEKYVYQLEDHKIDSTYFCIIGIRDNIPSCSAAIKLAINVQEELFGIPFANNVAPNWKAWSSGINTIVNKELIKSRIIENLTSAKGRRHNPIKTADAKPFKQILKTPTSGGKLGIWRKFLGLTGGHTYRLTASLNTLDMNPDDPDWSFSLHAVADSITWKEPTASQFANSSLGKMASLGNGITTNGKYAEKSIDIHLPSDTNSITVWLRLSAKKSAKVEFDYIRLEDLNAVK